MSAFWKRDKREEENEKTAASSDRGSDVSGNQIDQKDSEQKKDKQDKKKKKKLSGELKKKASFVNKVIFAPVISEDAMNKQAAGKYVFTVNPKSNKKTVEEAVKVLYEVEIEDVNLMNYKPKKRSFRRFQGQQKGYKKAIVTVKEGQEIKLFNE